MWILMYFKRAAAGRHRNMWTTDRAIISSGYLVAFLIIMAIRGTTAKIANYYPSNTLCPNHTFRCDYGFCVPEESKCNGVSDCWDGSDERASLCWRNLIVIVTAMPGRCLIAVPRNVRVVYMTNPAIEIMDGTFVAENTSIMYECRDYLFMLGSHTNFCLSGSWREPVPDCLTYPYIKNKIFVVTNTTRNVDAVPGQCSSASPRNGRVFYESNPSIEIVDGAFVEEYTSVIYQCRSGWNLLGSNSSFCESGSWTDPAPSCLKYCSPDTIRSESVVAQCEYQGIPIMCHLKMLAGTIARISCAFGYHRVPDDRSDITVCGEDGYWDRQVLKCEQICGQLADQGVAYMVGGERRNNTKVPWHAAIYNDLSGHGKFVQSCGGTILSNRVVVSAAHCFWDQSDGGFYDMKHFQVVVGKYYREWNAAEPLPIQKISVKRIEYLQAYRDYEKLYTADIALLVLAEAIVFRAYVVPICMEFNLQFNEKRVTGVGLVAGWGLTVSGGAPSTELKVLQMPAIDLTVCEDTVPENYARFVTSDKFCAGYTNGQSVCQGDSGGGLVFMKTVNGKTLHYLRGIVSSGPASEMSCASDTYSVFTNVHYYSDFIAETVHGGWRTVAKDRA